MYVGTDVYDVMAIKPNFLTSMGYHIFLTMVLRAHAPSARAELCYDPTSDPLYGGLKIKCIESGKGMTPLQAYEAKREPQFGKKKSFCLIKNGDIL